MDSVIVIGSQSYKVVLDIYSVKWTVCDCHRVTELQGGVGHLFCGVDSVICHRETELQGGVGHLFCEVDSL